MVEAFWQIIGTEKKMYTNYECDEILDKKTNKRYKLGSFSLFKEYPPRDQVILRDNSRYQFIRSAKPPIIQKRMLLWGKKRSVYQRFYYEPNNIGGPILFRLENTNLYTMFGADCIRDTSTFREYKLGTVIIGDITQIDPSLIIQNHPYKYEYIFNYITRDLCKPHINSTNISGADIFKELLTISLFNFLIKK